VSWIDNLINDIPAASYHRYELEAMEKENAALKQEIALLRSQLEALKAKSAAPDRMNGEIENILMFILRQEYANATQISKALSFSKQAVAMYIEDLLKTGFVETSHAGGVDAEYYLKQKAKRYLHNVGLM
jgi:DNA-binding MarR family transcriptional regulator